MAGERVSWEDQQERAEDRQALLTGLQQPGAQEETPADKTELIEQLTESDLVATDGTLQNLLTKDIPSANFSEEEAHEFRHYLDVVLERKRAAHPHEGQDVVGVLREWVHDDPSAGLDPVDRGDLLMDETMKQGVAARITKGKQGSLIGLALRSVRESVLRRDGSSSSGGGLLGRIRR